MPGQYSQYIANREIKHYASLTPLVVYYVGEWGAGATCTVVMYHLYGHSPIVNIVIPIVSIVIIKLDAS